MKTKKSVNWSQFQGHQIGVDVLGFLYKAKTEKMDPCHMLADYITFWRKHDIEPVFVFDGKTPVEKQSTRTHRKQQKDRLPEEFQTYVTSDNRNCVKQFLYACGCLFVNAEEEADSVLAYLVRNKEIEAIVSYDFDFLPRKCPHLIVPSDLSINSWIQYSLDEILTVSQLTYDQFLTFCVLLGCDYTPTIPNLTYQRAFWLIRYGNMTMEEILKKEGFRTIDNWIQAIAILRGDYDCWSSMLSEKQRDKWGSPTHVEAEYLDTMRTNYSLTDDQYSLLYKGRCSISHSFTDSNVCCCSSSGATTDAP